MLQFIKKGFTGKFSVMINGVERFKCLEVMACTPSWHLFNLRGDFLNSFDTLLELSDYVEEMDK